jgi:hypothetical protein
MMNSLIGTLRVVEAHLSSTLMSPEARDAVERTAARLPAALSHCMYLECHGASDAVDLIVDVDRPDLLAELAVREAMGECSEWQRVAALAHAWRDQALKDRITGIWLEFDHRVEDRSPARPSVFVDFAAAVYRDASVTQRTDTIVRASAALRRPVDSLMRERLHQHLATLPRSALLLYAGFMLPRPSNGIRVCIMGMTGTELERYLRDIGCDDHRDVVLALVRDLGTLGETQPAIIHLDVGRDGPSAIGLEYPFARFPQLAGTIQEARVVEYLLSRSYLTKERHTALAMWIGSERRIMPHEVWPSVVIRRANHVKLVVRADASIEAKLYLAVEHVALRRRRHRAQPK